MPTSLSPILQRLGDLRRKLDDMQHQLVEERQARQAAEQEVARLKAQLEQVQKKRPNGL